MMEIDPQMIRSNIAELKVLTDKLSDKVNELDEIIQEINSFEFKIQLRGEAELLPLDQDPEQ